MGARAGNNDVHDDCPIRMRLIVDDEVNCDAVSAYGSRMEEIGCCLARTGLSEMIVFECYRTGRNTLRKIAVEDVVPLPTHH